MYRTLKIGSLEILILILSGKQLQLFIKNRLGYDDLKFLVK